MQAGGRRFESDYLHQQKSVFCRRTKGAFLNDVFRLRGPRKHHFSVSIALVLPLIKDPPRNFCQKNFFKKSFTSAGKCAILLRQPKGRKEGKGPLSCFLSFGRISVGAYDGEGPPVPIPNTEVKLIGGDNTCLATDREDSTVPTQMFLNSSVGRARGC